MKRTITIMISLFAIMCLSGTVFAAEVTTNNNSSATGGGSITIGSGTNTLTINLSPGVLISVNNDISDYCIITGSRKAGDSAIQYCVASGVSSIGQLAKDLSGTATLDTPTSDGTLASSFTTQ